MSGMRRSRRSTWNPVLALGASAALLLAGCQMPEDDAGGGGESATGAAGGTGSTGAAEPSPTSAVPATPDTCEEAESASGDTGGGTTTEPTTSSATASADAERDISTNPEIATGFREGMTPVQTDNFSVVTANPLATEAACEVLRDGGDAADALVTAQFVLGLVEPQASGVGGGGYILYNDAESGDLTAIDGRETAPIAATGTYLSQVSREDTSSPTPDARRSGRSIGVPGVVAALGELHEKHGSVDWAGLLAPAESMATDGFRISERLSSSIADSAEDLARDKDARAYFLDNGGDAKKAGDLLKNPEYAATLSTLADGGADALYTGDLARRIVERVNSREGGTTPGRMSTADLAAYSPETHDAVCGPYRDTVVCGMPPSSSGGITVLSALGILENADLGQYTPSDVTADGAVPDAEAVHLVSEAERLAYADRDAYVADTAFTPLPGDSPDALLDEDYLRSRYESIDPETSMGEADPGELEMSAARGADQPEHGTSHISVIDGDGNAASMTTSVEAAFGSFHMVGGFLLNNQLTDFSEDAVDEDGNPVANRVEGAKRPRSSMAPMIIFDRKDGSDGTDGSRGDVRMVLGSPGGAVIPQFVVKTIVALVDWEMDPQQAVGSPNFGARNTAETGVGGENPLIGGGGEAVDRLTSGLEDRGHDVSTEDQSSGLSAIVRQDDGTLVGGADPRREGVVLGG
ncbi:MAG: gamma-glutamyltransferase [Corynebacterium sp.]|jgi:gamma-glutamyltranspeptidase/glutathione hydrolase|uniref:gamma-glutamyltransferase n=1 Tax=unclassified Corynebacterium TaxID=2624378 RepID=UPI0021018D6C|nr:gamma-glutamyltransferase [Corynebacterium sp. CNJ-954]